MEQLKAVILAAGKGTRMKSDLPKVVHTIEGKCLVDYAIDAAIGAGADDICLVVGYKHEVVENSISHKNVKFALQEEQLGTGHAVKCARDFLGDEGQTLILFGDTPLITAETLNRLAEHHKKNGNTVTVLSAMIDNPTGYGRIIRDAEGRFVKSVEHKDASPEELESHEINSGMYIFDTKELKEALDKLTPNNAQGEYYLPDTLTIIKNKGLKVDAFALDDPEDITGVNDQEQLAAAAEIIRARTAKKSAGVSQLTMESRGGQDMFLIVGLGNPTKQYEKTRHNIGFDVMDALADKYNISISENKHKALCGKGVIEGMKVVLAKPQTYMNLSGESVAELVNYYKLDPESELIVVFDDISLEPGNIRIRKKGSAGGHNGIKNIIAMTGTQNFMRIKVGVGEKPKGWDLADYVLGHFSTEDRAKVEEAIGHAMDATVLMMQGDVDKAMNDYNSKNK